MTQNSTKRWKVILPVSIAAILLVGVAGFNLFNPDAQAAVHNQGGGFISSLDCVAIEHFDKIIFKNEEDLLNAAGGLVEKESIMDIKVEDDPTKIEFPMKKAVQFLNDALWTTKDGELITLEDLELIDVEYAIVCVSLMGAGNT